MPSSCTLRGILLFPPKTPLKKPSEISNPKLHTFDRVPTCLTAVYPARMRAVQELHIQSSSWPSLNNCTYDLVQVKFQSEQKLECYISVKLLSKLEF